MGLTYIDYFFGFPIKILNARTLVIDGETLPDVDYFSLSDFILKVLIYKKKRLTGNEIRFIRSAMDKNLSDFARLFNLKHSAVSRWEDCGDNATAMMWPTEVLLRFSALNFLGNISTQEKCEYLMNIKPGQVPEEGETLTIDYSFAEKSWSKSTVETINLSKLNELNATRGVEKRSDKSLGLAA